MRIQVADFLDDLLRCHYSQKQIILDIILLKLGIIFYLIIVPSILNFIHQFRMNSLEKRTALVIAIIISLRMYGLFLIMPVFSIAGFEYSNSTSLLIGIAIGAYGLTQALLQIPLGLLSDIWGRKKVLILGLILFILGSVIAALSESIYFVIIGRFIQGFGAIASTGMALIADVSRPEQRTKMMAIVGSSIGLSFVLAFITAPTLLGLYGISGLFWSTAILAAIGLVLLLLFIKEPLVKRANKVMFSEVINSLKKVELLSLNFSVFVIHAAMSSVFVIIPLILVEQFNVVVFAHWKIYLPVLLASLVFMVPLIIFFEKKKAYFQIIGFALLGLAISVFALSFHDSILWVLLCTLVLFFALFNFLESAMPSLLSRITGEKYKGSAMGAYSSSQFFGAFIGASISGFLLKFGQEYIFSIISSIIFLAGLLILFSVKNSSRKIKNKEL